MSIPVTPKHRGKIKAEAIDMVLSHPVVEAIEHEGTNHRVIAVERITAPRVVRVAPVGVEHVVGLVIKPTEGDRRAALIPLGRVIENHIQDHRDTSGMQCLDQVLELGDLRAVVPCGRVAALGGVKANRAIAPVVAECITGLGVDPLGLPLVEFKDRHQLHAVHPDGLEVGDLLDHPLIGPRMANSGGDMPGESPHVHLVDHQILNREINGTVVSPVEVLVRHPRPVGKNLIG